MTKIQKLEREKKMYQYIPIVSAMLFILIMEIIMNGRNTILMLVFAVLLYVIYKCICKEFIKICDFNIEDELLKPEIKQQFRLSKEEYVEIFWNDETDTEEFSKEKMHKKYGSKFYAKLISDDEIEVVVKDEEGELMDKPKKITRFKYLREHYKTKP